MRWTRDLPRPIQSPDNERIVLGQGVESFIEPRAMHGAARDAMILKYALTARLTQGIALQIKALLRRGHTGVTNTHSGSFFGESRHESSRKTGVFSLTKGFPFAGKANNRFIGP